MNGCTRKRLLIIPFFLRNRGCRHRCVFCNERIIAGNAPPVTEDFMRQTVSACLAGRGGRYDRREIAFYGGSFTGMPRDEMQELLDMASALIAQGAVHSIRVSTRPDDIDEARIRILASKGVSAVEIGAQSMDDGVLRKSERGHTTEDVRRAVRLCRDRGLETGLHLMAGLPGESRLSFEASVAETIRIAPDTVRIHPVIVFRDTQLARLYEQGEYRPLSLEDAVTWCKTALARLTRARIAVIRLGLQATEEMEREGSILAGPWHPAFRSLVESELFRDMALELLEKSGADSSGNVFHVAPADLSSFNGPGGRNRALLQSRLGGRPVAARPDPAVPRGALQLRDGRNEYGTSIAEAAARV
ncbi:MAG TPA: radical SAM protein [Syntrophales bacterium]|nr:radical SAM protein [Syntrophales bacterium]